MRLREIASTLGLTERAAFGIVTDLVQAGYVLKDKHGRRNRYRVQIDQPLSEALLRQRTVGQLLDLLAHTNKTPASTPEASEPTPSPHRHCSGRRRAGAPLVVARDTASSRQARLASTPSSTSSATSRTNRASWRTQRTSRRRPCLSGKQRHSRTPDTIQPLHMLAAHIARGGGPDRDGQFRAIRRSRARRHLCPRPKGPRCCCHGCRNLPPATSAAR